MLLLNEKGTPQMELEGGELVISRIETKKLIKLAQQAVTKEDFKELGKLMVDIRNKQKKRQKQYVS